MEQESPTMAGDKAGVPGEARVDGLSAPFETWDPLPLSEEVKNILKGAGYPFSVGFVKFRSGNTWKHEDFVGISMDPWEVFCSYETICTTQPQYGLAGVSGKYREGPGYVISSYSEDRHFICAEHFRGEQFKDVSMSESAKVRKIGKHVFPVIYFDRMEICYTCGLHSIVENKTPEISSLFFHIQGANNGRRSWRNPKELPGLLRECLKPEHRTNPVKIVLCNGCRENKITRKEVLRGLIRR